MAFASLPMSFCAMATVCTVASALRAKRTSDIEARVTSYTFSKFIEDFGRTYEAGSAEYLHRYSVFEESMAQIVAKNADADHSWTAGVHPFMDLTDEERQRLHGYKPSGARRSGVISLELETNATVYGGSGDSFQVTMPPVLNQGSLCGSCWAISATQAVEVQLMKTDNPTREHLYGSPMRLSTQAVLECAQVENPHNCGGPGGCKGATSEVAFDYMRDHGIPLEYEHPYHPNPEKLSKHCPLQPYPANWARVTIDGWRALPSNKAQPLMQTLVEEGAVIVAIDSHNLYPYSSGIFDDCPKDAVVSHALLATGYGEDAGQKYWSLQNSWGSKWGEFGSVRLRRRDNEDQWCGTDHHPEEGFACDGDTKPVTVCGTCGILFDMVIPSGPQVQAPQQTGGDTSNSAAQAESDPTSSAAGAHVVNPNHGFSSWGMPPPSGVDLASANAQMDGYWSTPALHPSVNSNQAIITNTPDQQAVLPDAPTENTDQQQGPIAQSSNTFMPAPKAVLVPSSPPTEDPSSSVVEPTVQAVVSTSSPAKSQLPSVFAPESQSVVPPSALDSSAAGNAPTSDFMKMQQILKQHDALPEAVSAPPAEEQMNSDAPPPAEQGQPRYELPAEQAQTSDVLAASVGAKQPTVEGKVVQSDLTMERLWDQLPEAKQAADASGAAPVQDKTTPTIPDQQDSSAMKMPTPTTFEESVDGYNALSKPLDGSVAAKDVGSTMPNPAAEAPHPEVLRSPLNVQSSSVVEDTVSEVTSLDSNDDVAASPPKGHSITDGMKKLFSDVE